VLHPTKPPVNPHNGRGASHSRPEDWSSYAQAAAAVRRYRLAGVGFGLSEDDGYTGVDLDKCRDAKTGQIEPWAQEIVNFAETYSEVSQRKAFDAHPQNLQSSTRASPPFRPILLA
jgi:primase-polymerase (primpol)-like protein